MAPKSSTLAKDGQAHGSSGRNDEMPGSRPCHAASSVSAGDMVS